MKNKSICPYSDAGMIRLRNAILAQAYSDFKECNRHAKSLWTHNKKEDARMLAREIVRILAFIKSDWYKTLTDGNSPQDDIIRELINQTNGYIREYVKSEFNRYLGIKKYDKTRF